MDDSVDRTISEQVTALSRSVMKIEKDARKFDYGNTSAGIRARKQLQKVRRETKEIRKQIQMIRYIRRDIKDEVEKEKKKKRS